MRASANVIVGSLLAALLLIGCAGGPGSTAAGRSSAAESRVLADTALERGDYLVAIQQYLNLARRSSDVEYARFATELAWEFGYDTYALAAAERWVALAPDDVEAHGYLGRMYVRRNLLDKAWDSLEIALGDPEERSDQHYSLLAADIGGTWARRGLKLMERFAVTYPDHAGIYRAVAELAAQTGDVERAIDAARATLSLRPDWYTTRVWLARLLLADEQYTAFEQMSFALEMNPGIEMEVEFVLLMAQAGETDAALERFDRLVERYGESLALQLVKATLLLRGGRDSEAAAIYAQLLDSGDCLNECLWQLGSVAFASGDYMQARTWFTGIQTGERLRQARLAISQCELELGDTDSALQVLRDFAAEFPQHGFDMLQPQAAILAGDRRWEEAIAVIDTALDYSPWNENLWLSRGNLLEQSGDIRQALDAFRTAWELTPDDPTTLNAYGYTLTLATRRYREAYDLISLALAGDPGNYAIMDSMGWVLFKMGRRAEALEWLQRAYAGMPDAEIAAHLGEVLWVSGEQDAARRIWAEAFASEPDNRTLTETMQRLQP